ncbi:hypothetical protein KXQ82_00850 [Mucilaginibacter sp. HMF5004]|uniref:hypothetical protein n=1 Tax=Mucilaginibacter rivuli TaxID=2857527 RepID=UPI001C5FF63B|nr:hypothetical protein [Mucilaginibacter rivuli]MBW4888236.1 hypothetical protein [Mucilaginibacter rivuli]
MKNLTWIICLLALASCKKNDSADVPIPSNRYSDAKGTWIKVDSTQWYLTRLYNGGMVHVKLNGTTNADKIVIRTSGDGVSNDNLLPLDANKGFSTDVVNSFSVSSVQTGSFVSSTRLVAYRGTDTLTVTLTSGPLKY